MMKLVTYRCILVVAALVLVGGCGRPKAPAIRYAAPRPQVGDEAVVGLKCWSVKPPKTELGYATCTFRTCGDLLVKCEAAGRDVVRFGVYYQRRGMRPTLAYIFFVDYSTGDRGNRTTVKRIGGELVHRGELIDGWPVPFHGFLPFAVGRHNQRQEIVTLEGKSTLVRSICSADGRWKTLVDFGEKAGRMAWWQEEQCWSNDQWMWSSCRSSWNQAKEGWNAVRKTPPGPSSDQL